MTIAARSWAREKEVDVLEGLKPAYEKQGYKFIIQPEVEMIPGFLSGFKPDAIAERGNEKVIITVLVRDGSRISQDIKQLQQQISKQPGWRLARAV